MVVCKIPRMHLSRSYYRGGLHLCSGIIQPSFSPDARAVIIDSLQPQQTRIGNLDLHKVCSTIFTRSVMKDAVNLQLDHQAVLSRSGLKATKI